MSTRVRLPRGWLLIMVWPFTRLVHAWSVPVAYLRREPIVYRSRAPRATCVPAPQASAPAPPT